MFSEPVPRHRCLNVWVFSAHIPFKSSSSPISIRCNERSSGSHGRLFVRLLQLLAVTDALFLVSLLALTLLHSAAHAEVVLLRTRRRELLLAYAIGPLALPVLSTCST